jgi:hypothetical protein
VPPPQTSKVAAIELPATAWGGAPRGLLDAAGLRIRKEITATKFLVSTEESYSNSAPNLVSSRQLAGPGLSRSRFDLIPELASRGIDIQPSVDGASELERLVARMERCGDAVDMFVFHQLQTAIAPTPQLPSVVEHAFSGLLQVPMEGDGTPAFPNSSVSFLNASARLHYRVKLVPFLLRFMYDPALTPGDLSQLTAELSREERVFPASEGLLSGTSLLDAYLGPLLGCMTPAFWGFPATRSFGAFIYSLGCPLTGTRPRFPAELLQMLSSQSPSTTTNFPNISRLSCIAATEWWTRKLDELFGVVTDPSVYCLRDGTLEYQPLKNLHTLLTVEQVFRRVHSMQVSHRDLNARRVLLFAVLDSIEGLRGTEFDELCRASSVARIIAALKREMSTEAAELLLWPAERALAALRAVQKGFYREARAGATTFEYRDGGGQLVTMSLENAAAAYLKTLRNATHGHGDDRAKRAPRTNALLAAHDGELPQDLPLLGYVHLLKLLSDSAGLRAKLYFTD